MDEQVAAPAAPAAPENPIQQAAESPEVEKKTDAEAPAQDSAGEAEDPEKLPSWVKKKMRNLERSLRHELRKRGELEARLREPAKPADNQNYQFEQDDSETVSLSKAELDRMIRDQAQKLAPALKEQESIAERRQKVAEGLAKTWGQEGFNQRAQDLEAAFNGLTNGKEPKPAVDAIFEADDAAAVIEYLTDPDNSAEAESIARMGAVQAGRAIAKLEAKLGAAKKADKPTPSKAPAPIEADRGRGKINAAPDPRDTKSWMAWMNEREAKGEYR